MLEIPEEGSDRDRTPIDFIVVGAGAGGAPLAARLVERGYTVLVLEMGPRNPAPPDGIKVEPTHVPLLHPSTTEDNRTRSASSSSTSTRTRKAAGTRRFTFRRAPEGTRKGSSIRGRKGSAGARSTTP